MNATQPQNILIDLHSIQFTDFFKEMERRFEARGPQNGAIFLRPCHPRGPFRKKMNSPGLYSRRLRSESETLTVNLVGGPGSLGPSGFYRATASKNPLAAVIRDTRKNSAPQLRLAQETRKLQCVPEQQQVGSPITTQIDSHFRRLKSIFGNRIA